MKNHKKVAIQLQHDEHLPEMIRIARESGFEYVAIGFGSSKCFHFEGWEKEVSSIREKLEKNGLKCVMTHAPYYNLFISAEKRDPVMEKALFSCVGATEMLGADICAVHPRSFIRDGEPRETAVDRERSFKENVISFRPLVDEGEKKGVSVGIENLMRYPYAHPYFYSWIAEDQVRLIDEFKSDKTCAIWDFGHANLVDEDHAERIRKVGCRIKGTHVHNNDGVEDDHNPPFIPDPFAYYVRRTVDWKETLAALKGTGFDGYLTLEPSYNYLYPIDFHIRYLYESVCALDDILNPEKQG